MEAFSHGAQNASRTTNADSYTTMLTHATGQVPSGTYFVQWYFETVTAAGQAVEVRITADGAALGEGTHPGCVRPAGASGFGVVSFGGEASHTLEIAFRDPDSGDAAEIRNARIACWKLP